jgi:CheY-like chemotaxis protein
MAGSAIGAQQIPEPTATPAAGDELRMLDRFLATLGHELRNPLAAICNAAQLLHVPDLPEHENQLSRDIILRQSRLLARLVDDLLDASRITHGRIELLRQPVDLVAAIHTAVEGTRALMERSGHQLVLSLDPEAVGIEGDGVRVVQVFTNLLVNAATFTPAGGRIELRAEREGDCVVVQVADNGVGIPADMLENIFEPFSRVERLHENTLTGFGIGLTLARELVRLHGGTLEARSAGAGLGSEFIVRLPIVYSGSATARPGAASPRPELKSWAWHPWHRRRVLVVDDNADAASVLALLIGNLGFKVRTVTDGREVAAAVAEFKPKTIFLDLDLPGLDGYAVAERLRRESFGLHLRLIALSGWSPDRARARTLAADFNHYLVKPVDSDMLKRILIGPSLV